jgi:hypothetical protein
VLKLGAGFNTINSAPSTNGTNGKAVLTIADSALVDASKTTNLNLGTNYFVTSGTGALKRAVATTATVFPIGTSATSYNPVTLTNTGTADNYSVSLKDTFDLKPANINKLVNKQWQISEDIQGGSSLSVKLQWATVDQAQGFDINSFVGIIRNNGQAWEDNKVTVSGSGTSASPYTATASGLTNLGQFAVSNIKVDPVISVAGGTYTYDGNEHASNGSAYGTGGESDRLSPEVSLIYKDSVDNILAGGPVNVGKYKVVASFAGNSNYLPANDSAFLTILPRVLTIKANDQTKECGTALNFGATAFTANGLVGNDGINSVLLSSAGASLNGTVGSYSIAVSDAKGTGLSNYKISYESGNLQVEDKTKPVPVVTELSEINAECSVTISSVPTATDGCAGNLTATTTDPLTYNSQGTYTITWKYDDGNGNVTTQTQKVVLKDVTAPVISYCPETSAQCFNATDTYNVPMLKATDNCGTVNISYAISGATTRSGNGSDASGSFNVGTSTINWTVNDSHGNQATFQTIVTVNSAISVSIADVYAVSQATDNKNTLYIGYGPSSLTVTATSNGGTAPYSYKWSTGATTSSLSVSAAGTYSVIITDSKGCAATTSITISVADVSCGNNSDKVMICHNGSAICVASNAVQQHLSHGDRLGSCSAGTVTNLTDTGLTPISEANSYRVTLYPNPVAEMLNINLNSLHPGAVVQIYNALGTVVLTERVSNTTQSVAVGTLSKGMYYVVVRNGDQISTHKIVKQ